MERNKKILKIGLLVISLSLIMSLSFTLLIKLKNPLFLKNYIDCAYFLEDGTYSECELILQYITNVNDNRYITDIAFDEAPLGMDVITNSDSFGIGFPNFYAGNREQVYGRYKVNTIYVKIDLNKIDSEFEDLELNNAKIFFDNGTNLDVDIGKIRFFHYNREEENKYLESLGGGSSSDGTGNVDYRALEDITLLKLESSLLKELDNRIVLNIGKLNYLDIEGVEYKKRNSFSINYSRNYNEDIIGKYISYNISPNLYFKDNNGNVFTKRVREIRNNHYDFSFIGIIKYLRARGEI